MEKAAKHHDWQPSPGAGLWDRRHLNKMAVLVFWLDFFVQWDGIATAIFVYSVLEGDGEGPAGGAMTAVRVCTLVCSLASCLSST